MLRLVMPISEAHDAFDLLPDFGQRLKSLRSGKGWTLEETSERTALSKPYLSRLEAGERQPSIAAVLTLARVFGVSVGVLLDAPPPPAHNCVVVRHGDAAPRRGDGLVYTALSSAAPFAHLQPMRIVVSPHRKGSERFQHEGEEWVYVLSGQLRLSVAEQDFDLEPGDAAHFDSRQPHRLSARGGREVEVIVVAAPTETTTNLPRFLKEHRAIR